MKTARKTQQSSRKAPPASPATALQERKQQLVRRAIRDAALDLFLEKGFEATRIEDITERAGVSRRTFFRYFASKDDLMAQGVDEFGAMLRGALSASPPDRSLMDLFRETVIQVSKQCAADPRARDVVRVMLASPAARAAQHSRVVAVEDLVESLYRGRVKGPPQDKAAAGILAMMTLAAVGAVMRQWCQEERAGIEETARAVLASFERMIGEGAPSRRATRRFL
jgi:AcrR family transcriptional regulator